MSVRTVMLKRSVKAAEEKTPVLRAACLTLTVASAGSPPATATSTSSASFSSTRMRCSRRTSCTAGSCDMSRRRRTARRLECSGRSVKLRFRLQATVCRPPSSEAVAGALGDAAKTRARSEAPIGAAAPAAAMPRSSDESGAEVRVVKGTATTTLPVPASVVTASSASTATWPCRAPSLSSTYPSSARTATGTARRKAPSADPGERPASNR
mmetsp:Transcript_33802/g.78351  ORF Transcript_33802/g.78351 Transcript_33802/m.78351 type:complete len:211 (+) Transcript_33802:214-846(+)